MKIYVGHSRDFNFKEELYKPLRESELNKMAEIILPHENDSFFDSKAGLKTIDFMIAEVSYPSTGLGIELGWASLYNVPIVAVYKTGTKISSSVKLVAKYLVEYHSQEDLLKQLKAIIISN